jgi:hypothetical protein
MLGLRFPKSIKGHRFDSSRDRQQINDLGISLPKTGLAKVAPAYTPRGHCEVKGVRCVLVHWFLEGEDLRGAPAGEPAAWPGSQERKAPLAL